MQIFHHSTNTIAKVSIFGGVFLVAASLWVLAEINRSSYNTGQFIEVQQPVQFSHKHHVGDDGIDCRYCHTSVEVSNTAGMPPTKTCMNCHSQIWTNAPLLEPVRASFRDNKSLVWTRVHDLPDFVYFSHEIHVNKGIGCKSCHGPVDEMPLMYQAGSLQMEWCLDCHRDTAKNLRPKEEVFNMTYQPPARDHKVQFAGKFFDDQDELGHAIQQNYHIRSKQELTSCETCHR